MKPREKELLTALTNCVRVMTLGQVSRIWWSETRWGLSRTKLAAQKLADGGWLQMRTVLSRPVNPLKRPLVTWSPKEPPPDFRSLSRQLHSRAMVPAKTVAIVFSTSKTTALLGKGALPKIKLTQMTHDLHVSEVFLAYRIRGLPMGEWVGEDQLPHSWPIQQRPDAVLRRADGTIFRAIEYGGDYRPERLSKLHQGLSRLGSGLSYEIW